MKIPITAAFFDFGGILFLLLGCTRNRQLMTNLQTNQYDRFRSSSRGQENNVIKNSWPEIGCWFWSAEEFGPNGYKRFLDLHEKKSGFKLLTTSVRHPVEVTDPKVHDQIKAAAEYALKRGMNIVMDLDVRLARQAFMDRYPDEMQEIVRLREVTLPGAGEGESVDRQH